MATEPDRAAASPKQTRATFSNPVIPGFYPDPSICRVGETFYLVSSSFEYFPGIPLFESSDLVQWKQIGHVLTRESQLDLRAAGPSQGIYAPTIRWHDGVFFVTATNVSGGGHFIVHTTDPYGPWSEPVWVDQDGIDPSLYFEDGLTYFQSNVEPEPHGEHAVDPGFVRGIQQCVVDPFSGAKLCPTRFLWAGSGGRFPEAPHLFRRGASYYLLVAEGGTEAGHMVTIARAESPWGPFESNPANPILSHRSLASPIQSTGHADFVELDDGTWWAVLLGTRPHKGRHHIGRETFLAPVSWDSEGWPRIGENGKVLAEHVRPTLAQTTPTSSGRDDFDEAELAVEWASLRRPIGSNSSLTRRPGWLTLTGRSAHTGDPDLSFLGRRQQHVRFSASTLVEAQPASGEVGLIARMDERHHYEMFVTERRDNGLWSTAGWLVT